MDNYFIGFPTYKHYGVFIGGNKVTHFAPLGGNEISMENGIIHETTLENFLKGRALHVDLEVIPAFSEQEIVKRAMSKVGEKGYNLINNNCEHYARWCVTGNSESFQVDIIPKPAQDVYNEIRTGYEAVKNLMKGINF